MAKKIYDIKHPKTVHKVKEKELKEFVAKPVHHNKYSSRPEKKRSIWLPVSIVGVAVVLIVGVYLFLKLPKATVQIWPKVDTLSFQQNVVADKSISLVDATKNVIPAQYFEASKTEAQDFPATGNASDAGKASGTITVYNKYSPATPMTLKVGTHFMSDSGKLFTALQKVVVPAAKKSGSKITPGSVQVQVVAVEGGDAYNVAPSNFSVPGLKGTDFYYSIYAVSTSAMTGGVTGKIKKVTDDDLQGAKDTLTKKATDDAETALKAQVSSGYILLDSAILSSATNTSSKTKSGTIADTFNYSVTIKSAGMAFKKSDLDKFVNDYINSQMPQGKTMLAGSSKSTYSATTVDVSGGKETLSLDLSAGIYQNIDKNSISLSLLGENGDQINKTINSNLQDQVTKIKVNFWPFWVTKAPDNQGAVHIELKFQ